MLPWETLRDCDDRRTRRRNNRTTLEVLEGRQLLSYSSLGYSLPDVSITGQAGPVAAWGGSLTVKVTLKNTGASTIVEPLSQTPATQVSFGPDGRVVPPYYVPSSADAGTVAIAAFLTPRPHSMAGAISLGTFQAPALAQNDLKQFPLSSNPIPLPQRPSNLPATGIYYVRLFANPGQTLIESNYTNDISPPIPVRFVSTALPMLRVTALDVPSVMQPGDAIAPTFQITNLGSAATPQNSVQVALVQSTTPDFNLGSNIIAIYTLGDAIPAQSSAPIVANAHHHTRLFGGKLQNNNVTQGSNVATFTPPAPVKLPTSPSVYFLGVVIDPNNKLHQLSLPTNRLEQIRQVGPATSGLPPAGVVSSTALSQPFPSPPDGVLIGTVNPGNF